MEKWRGISKAFAEAVAEKGGEDELGVSREEDENND